MKRLLLTIFVSIIIFLLSVCKNWEGSFSGKGSESDLSEVMKKGSLVVATSNNPSDYFLYKGEPLGFQLEMLEELGNYLGLKIDVMVCNNPGDNVELLNSGKCDIIASSWNLSLDKRNFIETSIPLLKTDLLLVQRKPQKIDDHLGIAKPLVTDVKELRGKSVYLPVLSTQGAILNHFAKEKNIQVVEMPQYSTEKLVEFVAKGEVDYTICNSILAETLKGQYPTLDFNTVIKKSEPIVWTFRKTSPKLVDKVNDWLQDFQKSTRFALLLDKYFNQQNKWAVSQSRYFAYRENRISIYDELIKKYSVQINWDWRLLASLIYQESRFIPNIKSYRGAFGLMQLMPATREYFGIDTTANPEQQIRAGVNYIKFLDKSFATLVTDPKERINFILASYNIGPGHIFDALKLAHKFGKNPQKWFDNVDSCLLKKSEPQNYKDPMVEYGYCKGIETFSFVQEIIQRYHHYRNVISNK
ncbi:MAG TPA: transporter substrate-binding domain-containing protein [Bacteroidales bacterium]